MFLIFFNRIALVATLLSTLLFLGCSTHMTENDDQLGIDDPDRQLIEAESDITLAEELKALSMTGQWGKAGTSSIDGDKSGKASPYDFPVVMNPQVKVYLDLFQNKQRKQFNGWLSRSGKYKSLMEKNLKQAGLPTDLIYLSMIESAYSPRAYSSARAVGLWQFMQPTGAAYDLQIDKYIDERRDAEKSTAAAAAYLNDLYQEFGDWHLAVAAYNAGPGTIKNGLHKYNVDNFWDLAKHDYLHLETKRYVPKLVAAIIIARQPEKFGFKDIQYEQPLAYDTVAVPPGMSIDAIALISGAETDTIKELNLELKQGHTPERGGKHTVKIPAGTKQLASRNIDRLHSYVGTAYKTHTIRKGDNLAQICKQYDINTTTLLKVNNLRSARLQPGTHLRIPYRTVKYQLVPEGETQQLASYKDNLILHRIKKGETISAIAKKYRVPASMIVSWNGLQSVNKIRTGQQLSLFIEDAGKKHPSTSQTLIASNKRLNSEEKIAGKIDTIAAPLTLKAEKKIVHAGTQRQRIEPVWYQVQSGDSLWDISRKFKVSSEQIKEWNNLSDDLLHPGSRLKVKKV